MKQCTVCKEAKEFDQFYKRADRASGYHSRCKSCALASSRKNKGYFSKNYLKNHEENKAYRRAYLKANIEAFNRRSKKYLSAKKQATPLWLSIGSRIELKWAYELARERSKETKIRHEVDHIIPLQGKEICGLHVPWNLQIVTSSLNKQKGRAL